MRLANDIIAIVFKYIHTQKLCDVIIQYHSKYKWDDNENTFDYLCNTEVNFRDLNDFCYGDEHNNFVYKIETRDSKGHSKRRMAPLPRRYLYSSDAIEIRDICFGLEFPTLPTRK